MIKPGQYKGTKLHTSVEGMEAFTKIKANITNLVDSEELLDEVEALLLNRIRTRFLHEEGPDGKWIESMAAKIRKAGGFTWRNGKAYTATGTLFETGRLFHSIQAIRGGPGERLVKSDVEYGKFHQYGEGDAYRPFLGWNNSDLNVARKLIELRLAKAMGL